MEIGTKGHIFDFNGTMFFDSAKHDFAWRQYLEQKLSRDIRQEELRLYVYGRTSDMILTHFLQDGLSEEERRRAACQKETLYRRLCREDAEHLHLAKGLPAYLDDLKERGASLAIASAANLENIEFYFEVFGLEKWFDFSAVVYDDGSLRGKPAPDYYEEACRRIGCPPAACCVYEDSVSGMEAARAAGVQRVVAVCGDADEAMLRRQGLADWYMKDFTQMG